MCEIAYCEDPRVEPMVGNFIIDHDWKFYNPIGGIKKKIQLGTKKEESPLISIYVHSTQIIRSR